MLRNTYVLVLTTSILGACQMAEPDAQLQSLLPEGTDSVARGATPTQCKSCLPNPDDNGGQSCSMSNCTPWTELPPRWRRHEYYPIMCDLFTLGTEHCITTVWRLEAECDARWDCGSGLCDCAGRGKFQRVEPVPPSDRTCHNHCEGLNGNIRVGPGAALHAKPFWNCVHGAPCDLREAQSNVNGHGFPARTSGSCWQCWDRDTCNNGIDCNDESHESAPH